MASNIILPFAQYGLSQVVCEEIFKYMELDDVAICTKVSQGWNHFLENMLSTRKYNRKFLLLKRWFRESPHFLHATNLNTMVAKNPQKCMIVHTVDDSDVIVIVYNNNVQRLDKHLMAIQSKSKMGHKDTTWLVKDQDISSVWSVACCKNLDRNFLGPNMIIVGNYVVALFHVPSERTKDTMMIMNVFDKFNGKTVSQQTLSFGEFQEPSTSIPKGSMLGYLSGIEAIVARYTDTRIAYVHMNPNTGHLDVMTRVLVLNPVRVLATNGVDTVVTLDRTQRVRIFYSDPQNATWEAPYTYERSEMPVAVVPVRMGLNVNDDPIKMFLTPQNILLLELVNEKKFIVWDIKRPKRCIRIVPPSSSAQCIQLKPSYPNGERLAIKFGPRNIVWVPVEDLLSRNISENYKLGPANPMAQFLHFTSRSATNINVIGFDDDFMFVMVDFEFFYAPNTTYNSIVRLQPKKTTKPTKLDQGYTLNYHKVEGLASYGLSKVNARANVFGKRNRDTTIEDKKDYSRRHFFSFEL